MISAGEIKVMDGTICSGLTGTNYEQCSEAVGGIRKIVVDNLCGNNSRCVDLVVRGPSPMDALERVVAQARGGRLALLARAVGANESWQIPTETKPAQKRILEKLAEIMRARTRLIDAAHNGNFHRVKELLAQGVNVNVLDPNGDTPLMLAAESGHFDIAQLLLEKGADKDAKGDNKMTAMMFAAKNGHLNIVQLLWEKGADVHAIGYGGGGCCGMIEYNALVFAVAGGNLDVVKFFFEKNETDPGVNNLLIVAAGYGSINIMNFLLERGADENARDNAGKNTPLMWASFMNQLSAVNFLLSRPGTEIDAENEDGETALEWGATDFDSYHPQIAMVLLKKGARAPCFKDRREECKGYDKKWVTLMSAVMRKHREIIRNLLDEGGVDVNFQDKSGFTLFQMAVVNNNFDIAKDLLKRGVDVNLRDPNGNTPLMNMVMGEDLDGVRFLLSVKRVDVMAKNSAGKTALQLAEENNFTDIYDIIHDSLMQRRSNHR